MPSVIYRCIIGGYLVILVLQGVIVCHMAYGRLHVTEHTFQDEIVICNIAGYKFNVKEVMIELQS